jgi:hypothetical protein
MLRQYHTPEGVVEREPAQEELDREFEMIKISAEFQMIIRSVAELTGKKTGEVEAVFKKNYKG